MNFTKLTAHFLFLFILSQVHLVLADGHGKEAGHTINCTAANAEYPGLHFYDFLEAKTLYPERIYATNIQGLILALNEEIPSLARRLREMNDAFESEKQVGDYKWFNRKAKNISDAGFDYFIEGCDRNAIQLIVNDKNNATVNRLFAKRSKIQKLEKEKSWIFLHEILWEFYDTTEQILIINEFIHNTKNYTDYSNSRLFLAELNMLVPERPLPLLSLEDARTISKVRKFIRTYKNIRKQSAQDKYTTVQRASIREKARELERKMSDILYRLRWISSKKYSYYNILIIRVDKIGQIFSSPKL